MNVMNDILEKIQAYNTIIIHRHQNPDPDAIGSQVGLGSPACTSLKSGSWQLAMMNRP